MGDHEGELVHYTLECMAFTGCPVMDVQCTCGDHVGHV